MTVIYGNFGPFPALTPGPGAVVVIQPHKQNFGRWTRMVGWPEPGRAGSWRYHWHFQQVQIGGRWVTEYAIPPAPRTREEHDEWAAQHRARIAMRPPSSGREHMPGWPGHVPSPDLAE